MLAIALAQCNNNRYIINRNKILIEYKEKKQKIKKQSKLSLILNKYKFFK